MHTYHLLPYPINGALYVGRNPNALFTRTTLQQQTALLLVGFKQIRRAKWTSFVHPPII